MLRSNAKEVYTYHTKAVIAISSYFFSFPLYFDRLKQAVQIGIGSGLLFVLYFSDGVYARVENPIDQTRNFPAEILSFSIKIQ